MAANKTDSKILAKRGTSCIIKGVLQITCMAVPKRKRPLQREKKNHSEAAPVLTAFFVLGRVSCYGFVWCSGKRSAVHPGLPADIRQF